MSFEVNRILRDAAAQRGAKPLIAYPSAADHAGKYNVYTASQVDGFVRTAVGKLRERSLDLSVCRITVGPGGKH